MAGDEFVVLCDDGGRAIGTQSKATVHHASTPLHLAFSCYVFDDADRVLVTRRATGKPTWPGVRTNSCCGHPLPDEPMADGIGRRLRHELGLTPVRLDLVLPTFRYQAIMTDGTMENELCPVYRAVVDAADLQPNTAEVADAWWQTWPEFNATAADPDDVLSPWSSTQLAALRQLGSDPRRWPPADRSLLPAAALCDRRGRPERRGERGHPTAGPAS
jgi:isopentenyl-diphosphate delta-isomerase